MINRRGVSHRRRVRGFTLVELLIAMAITILIAGAIAGVAPQARAAFERVPADLEMQQRGRTAIDVKPVDVRPGVLTERRGRRWLKRRRRNGETDGVVRESLAAKRFELVLGGDERAPGCAGLARQVGTENKELCDTGQRSDKDAGGDEGFE